MYNPLTEQIEELSSKIIGNTDYKGRKVVLLDDAIEALEQLEKNLSAIYQQQIDRIQSGLVYNER